MKTRPVFYLVPKRCEFCGVFVPFEKGFFRRIIRFFAQKKVRVRTACKKKTVQRTEPFRRAQTPPLGILMRPI